LIKYSIDLTDARVKFNTETAITNMMKTERYLA